MELIYLFFIYPLEYLMQLILESSLSLTGNPLISLICVSFAVVAGSLPLYHLAETWQDRERSIQKKLKPKIAEFKSVYKGSVLNSYINTLYKQNSYHPVYAVRTSFGLLIQIPFFFAAYHLLSNYHAFDGVETILFKDLGKPDGLLVLGSLTINIMPFIMTGINLLSANIYGRKTTKKEKIQLYGMALLFLAVLYNSSSALLFYWTFNNLFSLLKNVGYNKVYKDGVIECRKEQVYEKYFDTLFRTSLFAFIVLTFIAAPLTLLSSGSPSDFEESIFFFTSYLAVFSLLFFMTGLFVYVSVAAKVRKILTYLVLFLLFFSLLNVFIFSGNYGDMSHFVFADPLNIAKKDIYTNLFGGLLTAIILLIVFVFKMGEKLIALTTVVAISLAIFSLNEAKKYHDKRNTSGITQMDDEEVFFNFSKEGKNVIILMLDRFIGGYIPQILEFIPELNEDLDGFVWYKNSLSPASYTIGGVPPIMGGWEYNVNNINSTRKDVPLVKKLDESVRIMPYNFDKEGWQVRLYQNNLSGWFDESNREYLGNSVFVEPDYKKYREKWLERYDKGETADFDNIRKNLIVFGIFRASPLILREMIYDDGSWHLIKEEKNNEEKEFEQPDNKKFISFHEKRISRRNTTLNYYSVLDFLPELSSVNKDSENNFYYMTNDLTHSPFSINSDFKFEPSGRVSYPRNIYRKFKRSRNALRHLYTDAAALRLVNKWLLWMKKNGVYDNTRIIIVSDHGRDVYSPFFKQQKIPGARKKAHPAYFDNLILFKDFNKRGNLEISEEFMSCGDIPVMAMEGLVNGVNPFTNRKIESPANKFPFIAYDVQWRIDRQKKYEMIFHEAYEIKRIKDINSPSKWRVINE